MATTPRRSRAAALSTSGQTPRVPASAPTMPHMHRHSFYVMSGTLLALIFLTATVFLLLLSPFFVPARSILSVRAKAALCSEFIQEYPGVVPGVSFEDPSAPKNPTPAPGTVCTEDYRPVCGEVDVQCIKAPCPPIRNTYPNLCFAQQANARILNEGVCPPTPEEQVRVSQPIADQKIVSPLVVKGEAQANWFFEAQFPVVVVDQSEKVLGSGVATALRSSATDVLVVQKDTWLKFEARVNYKKGTAKAGYVILKRDNPSGLPENEAAVRIPVVF